MFHFSLWLFGNIELTYFPQGSVRFPRQISYQGRSSFECPGTPGCQLRLVDSFDILQADINTDSKDRRVNLRHGMISRPFVPTYPHHESIHRPPIHLWLCTSHPIGSIVPNAAGPEELTLANNYSSCRTGLHLCMTDCRTVS